MNLPFLSNLFHLSSDDADAICSMASVCQSDGNGTIPHGLLTKIAARFPELVDEYPELYPELFEDADDEDSYDDEPPPKRLSAHNEMLADAFEVKPPTRY